MKLRLLFKVLSTALTIIVVLGLTACSQAGSVDSGAPASGRVAEGEAPKGAGAGTATDGTTAVGGSGGHSGPGYPTGPLDVSISAAKLMLDRVGAVKAGEVQRPTIRG